MPSNRSMCFLLQANAYLTLLFTYLVNRGYFEQVRCLIDNKIPPLLEASPHPPTQLAACLFDMITRPLQLVTTAQSNSPEFRLVSDIFGKKLGEGVGVDINYSFKPY
jgi:hypothetical protein